MKAIDYVGEAICATPPCFIWVRSRETWLEDVCDSTKTSRGVEWDWLSFFWNLWTEDATYKYSLTQITNVWNKVHDLDPAPTEGENWLWGDLLNGANALYSGSKYLEFVNQGDEAGVNH